ncbi:MAG: hypothetical protein RLO51_20025 [Thalassobaculum sp.]|uniref:helix-turn-helix domain-containing protein n=1 Tax=Thalassobaculum sp. TaxID=2022740 RepID=UPI0032EC2B5D
MTYHYTMCGLDYVHLINGYSAHETEYGEGVSIERADELDRIIAYLVLTSHARLRGQEVRFLRSLLHKSQAEIAAQLGVKRLTVARWEGSPNTPIPGPADRTLRIITVRDIFGRKAVEVVLDLLAEITDVRTQPLYMRYRQRDDDNEPALFPDAANKEPDGWKPQQIAA